MLVVESCTETGNPVVLSALWNDLNLEDGGVLRAFETESGLDTLLVEPFELTEVVGESASEGGEFENVNEPGDE